MQHLQIAYDLLVIMIGLAALAMALSWLLRTREADLRNFFLLYALFTAELLITLVQKYLFLNVAGYSARSWYILMGLRQLFDISVVVATIHFLLAAYGIGARRPLAIAFFVLMLIAQALVISPIGAVLDADSGIIHLGPGVEIGSGAYLASFTFAIVLGWGWLGRVWKTDRRTFILGLLIFVEVNRQRFTESGCRASIPGIGDPHHVEFGAHPAPFFPELHLLHIDSHGNEHSRHFGRLVKERRAENDRQPRNGARSRKGRQECLLLSGAGQDIDGTPVGVPGRVLHFDSLQFRLYFHLAISAVARRIGGLKTENVIIADLPIQPAKLDIDVRINQRTAVFKGERFQ